MRYARTIVVSLALLLVSSSAGVAAASGTEAHPERGDGGILFTRGTGSDRSIVLITASGSLRRLTPTGCCDSPAWSPDHEHIAFVRRGALAVMDADGTNVRTVGPATVFPPAWSPDATELVYAASAPRERNGGPLRVVDAATRTERTVAEVFSGSPTWAPASDIVFTALDEPVHLATLDPDGVVRPVTVSVPGETSWPAWSPDGARLAFAVHAPEVPEARGISVTAADGMFLRQVTNGLGDDDPAWSPDGTRIAFVRTIAGISRIFVVDVASGKMHRVSSGTRSASQPSW